MPTPIPELIARLRDVDESDDIEAKRSASELGRSASETISAFANEPGLGGGYLVFGLHEDVASQQLHIVGVKDPKKLEQDISSICATGFGARKMTCARCCSLAIPSPTKTRC
jgi:ATP-dependent DNA helicase RecG